MTLINFCFLEAIMIVNPLLVDCMIYIKIWQVIKCHIILFQLFSYVFMLAKLVVLLLNKCALVLANTSHITSYCSYARPAQPGPIR